MPRGKPPTNGFKKGQPKKHGRAPGSGNHYSRVLKEALLIAAEMEGSNGCGHGKLIGFLRQVAREDIGVFCSMLGRLIPVQENNKHDLRVEVTYRSVEEVRRELESRGIDIKMLEGPDEFIDAEVIDAELENADAQR